jgi:hypothetical protein
MSRLGKRIWVGGADRDGGGGHHGRGQVVPGRPWWGSSYTDTLGHGASVENSRGCDRMSVYINRNSRCMHDGETSCSRTSLVPLDVHDQVTSRDLGLGDHPHVPSLEPSVGASQAPSASCQLQSGVTMSIHRPTGCWPRLGMPPSPAASKRQVQRGQCRRRRVARSSRRACGLPGPWSR